MNNIRTPFLAILITLSCSFFAVSASAANVTVVNQSGLTITKLYLSESSMEHWGSDQLGEQVLGNQEQLSLKIKCGDYDLRYVDEDDDVCIQSGVYMCGQEVVNITFENLVRCQTGSAQAPATSKLTLVNRSGYTIVELFLSPSDTRNWGPDQLGTFVFDNNEQLTLEVACGKYDVRMVDEDEDECIMPDVYLCGSEEAVISEEMLLGCQNQ